MMEEFIHFASGTCCRYLNLALRWFTLVYMYVRIVTHLVLGSLSHTLCRVMAVA